MNLVIREEQEEDYLTIEQVIRSAFATMPFSDKKEQELVSRLRESTEYVPKLSLVAIESVSKQIIGHILLSKCQIVNPNQYVQALALAPVSVHPEFQNKGVGSTLIKESLQKAKLLNYDSVIVLGHPNYYPKFGFKKASLWNIKVPFEVPEELFMALELRENALTNVSGKVEYSSAFF
ncbi:N-acetyltransferase [Bacillus luteolus]|uniref:N-acetyltransferase n=1 Tax=Litchfieldia luteola TaxID=682179 RepID=A0ABR9QP61_9BACI|nr:N-acetyltransferase [Cytobacillus luteolus]MBE4909959.1 N-acetyltransferase [Cytobacillus luteolus]